MLKIISYTEEMEDVYDIEVPDTHNFVLDCGAIAHNCAHSTSYAIMCYNGAWLKRHHPAYFWLGELMVRMGDQDKLREYLNECSRYILPVSIIKSHSTEWKVEMVEIEPGQPKREMLRPPLQVVKGCGPKSVDNIKAFLDAKNVGDLFDKLVEVDEDHDERIDALTPEQIDAGEHYEFMDVE